MVLGAVMGFVGKLTFCAGKGALSVNREMHREICGAESSPGSGQEGAS